jgi:hypothetical protein
MTQTPSTKRINGCEPDVIKDVLTLTNQRLTEQVIPEFIEHGLTSDLMIVALFDAAFQYAVFYDGDQAVLAMMKRCLSQLQRWKDGEMPLKPGMQYSCEELGGTPLIEFAEDFLEYEPFIDE